MQTTVKHKQRFLQTVAALTATTTAWLITSPAIAAGTESSRAPKPLGHTRLLTTAEMNHICGSHRPGFLGQMDANDASGPTETWESSTDSGVSTASGNKLTQHPIVGWVQRGGLPVTFTLSHSSIGTTSNTAGKKWTHSFNVYLFKTDLDFSDDIKVVFGDGRGESFTANVDGSYSATAGIFDKLVKNADGTYTLTKKDLSVWRFNTSGWLSSIADKNANTLTLTYNTSNQVTAVTDATGRQLTFAWDSTNKRITSVTDPASRVWNLAYDASGNLSTVTDWWHPQCDDVWI